MNNPLSQGCHALIREGAQLVASVEHIIEQLAPLLGAYVDNAVSAPQAEPQPPADLSSSEQTLVSALGFEQTSMDQLIALTGISVADLNVLLISLELKGVIEACGDGYSRIR